MIPDCLTERSLQRVIPGLRQYLPMLPGVRQNALKKDRNIITQVKKRHTLKTQPAVNAETHEISELNFSDGKRHDFGIFKESRLRITEKIIVNADNGYPGIHRIHKNSLLPKKKSKKIRFP